MSHKNPPAQLAFASEGRQMRKISVASSGRVPALQKPPDGIPDAYSIPATTLRYFPSILSYDDYVGLSPLLVRDVPCVAERNATRSSVEWMPCERILPLLYQRMLAYHINQPTQLPE